MDAARVESGKLDRKLHELRESVYTWRDYRPQGKDKWMLFLSLREDKEQLMDWVDIPTEE